MDRASLAIPLGFIILAAVLCWQLIGGKWKWWAKLLIIVAVPAYGLAVWASIPSYQGWPSTGSPPQKALLYWMVIREPDPRGGEPGAIYIWVTPMDGKLPGTVNPLEYAPSKTEPRSFRLPYSRTAHQRANEAQQMILKTGQPMVFERGAKPGEGDGHASPGGSDRRGGDGEERGDPGLSEDEVYFYPLPRPNPTPKDP